MKKQVLTLSLALLVTITLVACGNSPESNTQSNANQSEENTLLETVGQSPEEPQSGQSPQEQSPEETQSGQPPTDQLGQPPQGQPGQRPEGQPGQPPQGQPGQQSEGQPGQRPEGQPGQPPAQMTAQYEPVELAVSSDLIESIMSSYSGKAFKEASVPDDILDAILQSGQKAPSATNAQSWHFTVLKNSETATQLVPRDYREGAVVIVVSGKPDERRGVSVAFDCALATQNMYLAAQSLGLGAHLYYGGVQNINDSMKDSLGIPDDYEAQIIMLVGYLGDDVDAVTSASPRNPLSGNVTYVE